MTTELSSARIPLHQWTHDGAEVLIVKCVNRDGTSYQGFQWPLKADDYVCGLLRIEES